MVSLDEMTTQDAHTARTKAVSPGAEVGTLTARMRSFNDKCLPGHRIRDWAIQLFRDTAKRAATNGLPFTLTPADISDLTRAATKCSVTGIFFSFEKPAGAYRRPFAPSVDRIKGALGYVPGNVRLVCTIANLAMNEWGETVLREFIVQSKKTIGDRRDRRNLGPAD
jgi:hypothetical protein